ncbi:MAG: hypothetical protein IBX62_02205, partial [Coriobacteriia bacterium]|nr:hypothetical protein [Coriobacteriia bacterium]
MSKHLVFRSETAGNTERLQQANISYFGTSSQIDYDVRNLETSRQVSAGTLGFSRVTGSRDAQGRPLSTTISRLPSAGTTYDAAGRMATQTGLGWSGDGALYTYGDSGNKTAESLPLAYPSSTLEGTYTYTDDG